MIKVAFGLGTNIGDKSWNLDEAFRRLAALDGLTLTARSAYYVTPPWGFEDQDEFVNAAALGETTLAPEDLLKAVKDLEKEMGRQTGLRWGPRLIDIDILTYGDQDIDLPDLIIPHPEMLNRLFVLLPLAEIWPDAIINQTAIADAIAALPEETITKLVTSDPQAKSETA